MKLLAINFGGIGDEILFLPALNSIRTAFPDCHITLVLEPRSKSIAEVTDLISEVVTFDIKKRPLLTADLLHFLGILRGGSYDIVMSTGSSPLVCLLLFTSGIKVRIGYGSHFISRFLLTNSVKLNKNQYAANMYHDLVTGLAISCTPELPKIFVPDNNLEQMRLFLKNHGVDTRGDADHKRVLIHPGSSKLSLLKGVIKTWADENWLEILNILTSQAKVHVILAGGPDDSDIVQRILAKASSSKPFINAFGATKCLADLAALIYLSDLLVCVDSAPMHMGVALGKKVVALFGPTNEAKLLPDDDRFVALREPGTKPQENIFVKPYKHQAAAKMLSNGSGVGIRPDIVARVVMDQLKKV